MNHYDVSVNSDSIRREELDGREHLVVPVRAVEEGVLDGGFLPADTIEDTEPGWNGVPAVAGHPTDGSPNAFFSANPPAVQENLTYGRLFEADATDGTLNGELWLDIPKARRLSEEHGFDVAVNAIEKLENGEDVAVSTSYIPTNRVEDPGHYDGKAYQHVLESIQPDHIGVLPDGQGRDPSARTLVANSVRSITSTLGAVLGSTPEGENETRANQEETAMPDLSLENDVAPFLADAFGLPEDDVVALANAMNPESESNPDAVAGAIEASDAVDAEAVVSALGMSDSGGESEESESDASGDGAGEGDTAANQGTDFSARIAANQSTDDGDSRDVSFGSYSSRRNADD
jgi:hypothetical protein